MPVSSSARRFSDCAIAGLHPDPPAVAMTAPRDTYIFGNSAVEQRLQVFAKTFGVFGVRGAAGFGTDKLLRRIAEHFEARRRDIGAYQIAIERHYNVGAVVGKKPVARFARLEALLRGDALLNVANDDQTLTLAIGEFDRLAGGLHPDVAAVLTPHPIGEQSVAGTAVKNWQDARRVVRVDRLLKPHSDRLVRFVAEQLAAGGRRIETFAVLGDQEDEVGRVFGEKPVAGFARLKPTLGLDALLNVAADGMDCRDAAVFVDQRPVAPGEPAPLAVRQDDLIFSFDAFSAREHALQVPGECLMLLFGHETRRGFGRSSLQAAGRKTKHRPGSHSVVRPQE